ncbi:hypothetical protein ABZ128_11290 [Streptomyces sp. NPDC006326]
MLLDILAVDPGRAAPTLLADRTGASRRAFQKAEAALADRTHGI